MCCIGGEWQDTNAIRNCAEARDWCAESRALFTNSANLGTNPNALLTPLPGYEELAGTLRECRTCASASIRANGAIFHNNTAATGGFQFSADGSNSRRLRVSLRLPRRHARHCAMR